MTDPEFLDARETRDPAEREADLMTRLAAQVAWAQREAPAFTATLFRSPCHLQA